MNNKILICGGTGLVGSNIIKNFKQNNQQFVLLTTQKKICDGITYFYWNPNKNEIDMNVFNGVSKIINLSGQGIFDKKFTDERKKELLESRTKSLDLLYKSVSKILDYKPNIISASAVGIYPNVSDKILTENAEKENTFISNLVQEWEQKALQFESIGCTVCILRIGIVLSTKGGFLNQLMAPIKFFAGAILGSGKQMVSWIHINDLGNLFVQCANQNISGTYNAVSGQYNSLSEVTKTTAKVLNRFIILPNVPVFALNLIFGKERAKLILSDQKVSAEKIKNNIGFVHQFNDLENATTDLIKNGG